MAHRGPDGSGLLAWRRPDAFSWADDAGSSAANDAELLLGHRRLSIIDLSEGGRQPMLSDDGRYALTFNGEIYNYIELRDELIHRHGLNFKSSSDTEVLLRAWAQWGPDCLKRLEGMYAFVMFDAVARKAYAVRDCFGIKPLFYRADADGFTAASEIRALIADGYSPLLDPAGLFGFLRWGSSDDRDSTLFAGVRQLPPASLLTLDLDTGGITIAPYWSFDGIPVDESLRGAKAREAFRELFLQTVDRHLRSDVPVVATLSGGIDSSAIVSAVRALRPDAPIQVFSYISDDEHSEEKWIDLVGRERALAVNKIRVDDSDFPQQMQRLVEAQEQPFASGSIYAQYRIFERIGGAGYKVMLDGQGADEILGGYKIYLGLQAYDLLKAGRVVDAARMLVATARRDRGGAWLGVTRLLRQLLPHWMIDTSRNAVGRATALPYAREDWLRSHDIDPKREEAETFRSTAGLRAELERAVRSSVLQSLLRFADRNAMAFSVENRVPFLSRPLVEFAWSLPTDQLIDVSGRSKAIVRDALTGILPDAIINRHDKIGFRSSESRWLRANPAWLDHEMAAAKELPFVDAAAIDQTVTRLREGDELASALLFRLIVLRNWITTFAVRIS